jgi:asparagine N-glycosylation enzyme membrane subunit Stt3
MSSTLTKAKAIFLMLVGALTAASPNVFRISAVILLLIYIIRYREDNSVMRMAAFVTVGYSVALFPSPWYALAAGVMLYLIYKRWEDAGFLGLLSGLSMVVAYAFYTFAEQKLGWLYGVRLFHTDPITSLILGYGLFYTGVAITAISMFLIFMRVAEDAAMAKVAEEQMLKRLTPKLLEEAKKTAEEKEIVPKEGEGAAKEEEKEKRAAVRLPRSVEI